MQPLTIERWMAERPVVGAGGETQYVAAPQWLQWETRGQGNDEGIPAKWLRVEIDLPPDAPEVWCQHAGAIAVLSREIPAGRRFRVDFKARAVSGARMLKVLRRWGGLKRPYWGGIELTDAWRSYSRELVAERSPTQFINFSVVATKRPPLQPLASGEFLLADVSVTPLPDPEADAGD